MKTEIQKLVNEIISLAPEAQELDEAGRQRLDELLSEELTDIDMGQFRLYAIEDKLNAGVELTYSEALEGLKLALDQVDAIRTINKMFLTELYKMDTENQRLRQQQPVYFPLDIAGNC